MDWRTEYRPSPLCLKEHGPKKAIVVRIGVGAILGSGKERMYEAWLNGKRIYDPADEYTVGQVIQYRPS
jgi:hypothetical protein